MKLELIKTSRYLVLNILAALFPLLLIPVLTRELSQDDYGRISLFMTFVMVGNLFSFNLQTYLRKIDVDKPEDSKKCLSSIWVSILLAFCFLSVLAIITDLFLDNFFGFEFSWVYIILLLWFLQISANFIFTLFEIRGKTEHTGCWNLIFSAVIFVFTYIFVVIYKFGWEGRIFASIVFALCFQLPIFIWLFKRESLGIKFDWRLTKDAFSFGLPLMPIMFGNYFLMYSDRFFIMSFLNLKDLGIYAVGLQLAMCIKLLNISISPIWSKYIFESYRNKNVNKVINNIFIITLVLVIISYLLSLILPHILSGFVDVRYHECFGILLLLFFIESLRGVVLLFTPIFTYNNRGSMVSYSIVFVSIFNFLLNLYLIPLYGLQGVIYATFLSYLVGICFLILKLREAKFFNESEGHEPCS